MTDDHHFNTTPEIVDDIRAGRMVILMDDEGRENEGDLIMAACHTRAEDINFMATHGRGLICLTLSEARCRQLRLPPMVAHAGDSHGTNFTVSIEAASGVTTGISAADRAATIQAAVAPNARPEDLVQPGHIFPLMAAGGGVLARAGHTEAGCDLARLAGLEPAATIVEILNPDGSMARAPQLHEFARHHGLKIGTIEDLIRWRVQHEQTVERVAETPLATEYGDFHLYAYQDAVDHGVHLAMVMGEIDPQQPVAVRVHVENLLCDSLGASLGAGWPLRDALARIGTSGAGVLVLLRPNQRAHSLINTIRQYQQSAGQPQADSPEDTGEFRSYGLGAQILSDLGIKRMRLMSAPRVFQGLAGFDLQIDEFISE
jgi:3,4-dihydroxy 2-butanone 4-phosphate synthase/GTP cyclohydrolase II